MADRQRPGVFVIKDCALIAIATGKRAVMLKELRDLLEKAPSGVIEYHFWCGMLQARFDEPELNNEFAAWVWHGLHDKVLAERLAVIDPADYPDPEQLRREVIDLIEQRLDESERLHWQHAVQPFELTHSKMVVFDSGRRVRAPHRLATVLPRIPTSCVFYHFVDARRRLGGEDDFRHWLEGFGDIHRPLCDSLAAIDPSFGSLVELRQRLADTFAAHFRGARS